MERWIELAGGLAAGILGLMCISMEAQVLANPLGNTTFAWLVGSNQVPGLGAAIANTQNALLPLAVVCVALALGAYLHAVHRWAVGLPLLVCSSAAVIAAAGFVIFDGPYLAILFVPAPLVTLTAILAAAASVCALSRAGGGILHFGGIAPRPVKAAELQADKQ